MIMSLVKGQLISGVARRKVTLKAASAWAKAGGFICSISATAGHARPATQADTYVSGWVDIGFVPSDSNISAGVLTVPASPGEQYSFNFVSGHDAVMRIPVTSGLTLTALYGMKYASVEVNSSLQTVDIDDATIKQVIILPPNAEDIAQNVATVIINPAALGRSATA